MKCSPTALRSILHDDSAVKFISKTLSSEASDASSGKIPWYVSARFYLGVFLFFIISYLALGWIGNYMGGRMKDSSEVALFKKWVDQAELYQDPQTPEEKLMQERGNLILQKLLALSPHRALPYEIKIANIQEPNAFATPGGTISISPSLFTLLETEEGLAFVIAHELGHHELRHLGKRLGKALTISVALGLVSNNLSGRFLGNSVKTLDMSYSRAAERDSDAFAVKLLQSLYSDLSNASEFFEKMESEDTRHFHYFDTHPLTTERLNSLKKVTKGP